MINKLTKSEFIPDGKKIILAATPVCISNGGIDDRYFAFWMRELPRHVVCEKFIRERILDAVKADVPSELFLCSNTEALQKLYVLFIQKVDMPHEERIRILAHACAAIKCSNISPVIAVKLGNFLLGESIHRKDDFLSFFAQDSGTYEIYK